MDNLLAAFTAIDSRRSTIAFGQIRELLTVLAGADKPLSLTGYEFAKLLNLLSHDFVIDVLPTIMRV
jgi:hypothetical protein